MSQESNAQNGTFHFSFRHLLTYTPQQILLLLKNLSISLLTKMLHIEMESMKFYSLVPDIFFEEISLTDKIVFQARSVIFC